MSHHCYPQCERDFLAAAVLAALVVLAMSGCTLLGPASQSPTTNSDIPGHIHSTSQHRVLGQNTHVMVVVAGNADTATTLAAQYLNDPNLAWVIQQENGKSKINQGDVVVIPKQAPNPNGVDSSGFQVVPVLSYHHFGERKNQMTVSPGQFRAQLTYLRDNGYHVIPLDWLADFLAGARPLPPNAVVITIDDGYRSAYSVAFPMLAEFGYTATLFVYSDYISNGGVSWSQLREMNDSRVISVQAHSKTHANLNQFDESDPIRLLANIRDEVVIPKQRMSGKIDTPITSFAFPFGATNGAVNAALKSNGYRLGLTVDRGPNPFYADPYHVRRTMIYGSDDLTTFAAALNTRRVIESPTSTR